jgi:ribonucleoside-triphosphate reductase
MINCEASGVRSLLLASHEKEIQIMSTKCSAKTEVYSRVCGFFRPVQQWNKGKKEEFRDRQEYVVEEDKV